MRILLFFTFLFPVLHAETTILHCTKLLDVKRGAYINDALIVINGNAISDAGPSSAVTVPSAATRIELPGVCLPGLIDVHDHLTADPSQMGYSSVGISIPRMAVTGVKNASKTLRAGFTTVRNVGADGYSDIALRDGIEAGDVEGPRILASGPALGITGGHCDENLLAPQYHRVGEGVADGPWAA